MSSLFAKLNEEQKKVAFDHIGKMAVLAGPGAGNLQKDCRPESTATEDSEMINGELNGKA